MPVTALAALLLVSCAGQAALRTDERGVVGFEDFSKGSDKSFGLFVCVEGGEVSLRSVETMSVDGDIELLGGYLFIASEGFLSAVDGFPPTGLDESAYVDVDHGVVSTDCDDADPEMKTQVIIGARRTSPSGGRIDGIRIKYSGGTLAIPGYSIALCGDELEHCEDLGLG